MHGTWRSWAVRDLAIKLRPSTADRTFATICVPERYTRVATCTCQSGATAWMPVSLMNESKARNEVVEGRHASKWKQVDVAERKKIASQVGVCVLWSLIVVETRAHVCYHKPSERWFNLS
jgi:hypothetical protein